MAPGSRPARLGADFHQNGTDTIINTEGLSAYQLVARQQSFGVVTQIDDHTVTGDLFNCTGHQVTNPILVLGNHQLPFGVADGNPYARQRVVFEQMLESLAVDTGFEIFQASSELFAITLLNFG